MKALIYYSADKMVMEDLPVPEVGEGELLVKIKASGVCTGEAMDWYMKMKSPLVPGHEPAGEIVEVGKGVENFRVGDRVFVHHHVPCMTCEYCHKGLFVECPKWKEKVIDPGAMAEYIRVKPRAVKFDTLKLPSHMSYEEGALIEPVACSVKAMNKGEINYTKRVLIIGLGFMGVVNALLAMDRGAKLVAGLDLVNWRVEKARELGLEFVENPQRIDTKEWAEEITKGKFFDVVIVGPGIPEVIRNSTELVSRGGRIILFAPTPPGMETKLDFFELYMKEISVLPSYSAGPFETREAMRLIEKGVVPARKLITHRFKLIEADRAYELLRTSKETLKIMVVA